MSNAVDALLSQLCFNEKGLIPAIAQCHISKQVLMFAWMNEDSVRATLQEGNVCYYSRSRSKLWRKGEESGHVQRLVSLHVDCDSDCLLLFVDQTGPACHTYRPSCFFYQYTEGGLVVTTQPQ